MSSKTTVSGPSERGSSSAASTFPTDPSSHYFLDRPASLPISALINTNSRYFAQEIDGLDWSTASIGSYAEYYEHLYQQEANTDLGLIEHWSPLALSAKSFDADNPTYFDLKHMPESKQVKWREAMKVELNELEARNTFTSTSRKSAAGEEIVGNMWCLQRKRLPDGTILRYKARLVVRGDQQKTELSQNQTFAPVIEWSTVQLLLVLLLQQDLPTCSIDFKNSFVQSDLPAPIYVEYPPGYGAGREGEVLKVIKSLYGDQRAPQLWYHHLKGKLEALGFRVSNGDPCMFLGLGCVFVTYVDNAILLGQDQAAIDKVLQGLDESGLDYNLLGDLASYLGVKITKSGDGSVELTQPHLTNTLIAALGLEDSNSKLTPASQALGKSENEAKFQEEFNYRPVVGMGMYIGNHSRLDCAFAIHQCARFSADPRHVHGEALKRIGHYLKGTRARGFARHAT